MLNKCRDIEMWLVTHAKGHTTYSLKRDRNHSFIYLPKHLKNANTWKSFGALEQHSVFSPQSSESDDVIL